MEKIMPGEMFSFIDSKGNRRYWLCVKCEIVDKDGNLKYLGITTEPDDEKGIRTKIYSKDDTPFYWLGHYIEFDYIDEYYHKENMLVSAEDILLLKVYDVILKYRDYIDELITTRKSSYLSSHLLTGLVYKENDTDDYFIPLAHYQSTIKDAHGYKYNPQTKSLDLSIISLSHGCVAYGYIKPEIFVYITHIYNNGFSFIVDELQKHIFVGNLDSIVVKLKEDDN